MGNDAFARVVQIANNKAAYDNDQKLPVGLSNVVL